MLSRVLRNGFLTGLGALIAGCNAVVLHPAGDISSRERSLIIESTILMLLIVAPVMLMTAIIAWRYRESNTKAVYQPHWHHSTQLELVIWSAPLLIIIALGALTWIGTHTLDPYRPTDRLDATHFVSKNVKPLNVEVVALDWKWLFIYPDYGIASVNELAAPTNTPIVFKITSSSVMNSFFVPALAGQIYAMPGMETQLHAVINQPGNYVGYSANYSGAGFSDMRFRFAGMSSADFDQWIAQIKAGGGMLDRKDYMKLEQPSQREPVRHFAGVAADLYSAILNLCVDPNKMCMRDMMAIDAKGGLGLAAVYNVSRLAYDQPRARDGSDDRDGRDHIVSTRAEYVTALCAADPQPPSAHASTVLSGASDGLARFAP